MLVWACDGGQRSMSAPAPPPSDPPEPPELPVERSRRHWTIWLLLIPFAAVLDPALYAHDKPQLAGIPFFVWYQMLWVVLAAAVTGIVYWFRRRER